MKQNRYFVRCVVTVALLMGISSFVGAQDIPPFTSILDTKTISPGPITDSSFKSRDNWHQIPEENISHTFQGDTVLLNNRIAVVIRQTGKGAELYSRIKNQFKFRARLNPFINNTVLTVSKVDMVNNTPDTSAVKVTFQSKNGRKYGLLFELDMGQPYIYTKPDGNIKDLQIDASSRFALLPDFFTDDIVIDAKNIPVDSTGLPSDNFFMQLLDHGNSILMSVCNTNERDIKVQLSGQGSNREITQSDIAYGQNGEIWVAVLEQPGIWYHCDISLNDAGKILPLDWEIPYIAHWRVDWQCTNGLTDSWEMVSRLKNGTYKKHYWLGQKDMTVDEWWQNNSERRRWMTVLGSYIYPCWIDRKDIKAYFEPLKEEAIQFEGPVLIYPIDRLQETPLDQFTIVDIIRGTLGVGPCEYILDLEGQQAEYQGIATCTNRNILNAIYEKKQQKQKTGEIEEALHDVMIFIRHIRNRIEEYVQFGHTMLDYLKEQKTAHPELKEPIGELESLIKEIDKRVEERFDKIKTPEYAQKELVDKFRATLLDYEGEDATDKCKEITAALVEIGGNQDELVGEARMVVKLLRQRASLQMMTHPEMEQIAETIRERSQDVLRNPAGHEGSHH